MKAKSENSGCARDARVRDEMRKELHLLSDVVSARNDFLFQTSGESEKSRCVFTKSWLVLEGCPQDRVPPFCGGNGRWR